jgi:hypothetical protein
MKKLIFMLLISMSGCTSSNYAPVDDKQPDILWQCKKAAFADYSAHSCTLCGAFGAIGGLASASSNPVDANKEIQECMKKHGYSGTSSGYN